MSKVTINILTENMEIEGCDLPIVKTVGQVASNVASQLGYETVNSNNQPITYGLKFGEIQLDNEAKIGDCNLRNGDSVRLTSFVASHNTSRGYDTTRQITGPLPPENLEVFLRIQSENRNELESFDKNDKIERLIQQVVKKYGLDRLDALTGNPIDYRFFSKYAGELAKERTLSSYGIPHRDTIDLHNEAVGG